MSAKATQYSKMVVTSALALPLILSLFSLSTPAKADLQFFQPRSSTVVAEGLWPTATFVVFEVSPVVIFGFTSDDLFFQANNLPTSAFQATPNLHTATLSPVTLQGFCLSSVPCGSIPPGGSCLACVTLQATWSASGPPEPSYGTQHTVSFKGVEVIFSGGTTTVPATATGTLNGQNLGQSEPSNAIFQTAIIKSAGLSIKTCPSPVASGHTGEC